MDSMSEAGQKITSSALESYSGNPARPNMPVRSRLIVGNLEATCEAARAGIGIATAFSHHVAESIKSGELTLLLQNFEPPPLPVSFVYPPDRFMPVKLRAFVSILANVRFAPMAGHSSRVSFWGRSHLKRTMRQKRSFPALVHSYGARFDLSGWPAFCTP
jgi:hypothetical protein